MNYAPPEFFIARYRKYYYGPNRTTTKIIVPSRVLKSVNLASKLNGSTSTLYTGTKCRWYIAPFSKQIDCNRSCTVVEDLTKLTHLPWRPLAIIPVLYTCTVQYIRIYIDLQRTLNLEQHLQSRVVRLSVILL